MTADGTIRQSGRDGESIAVSWDEHKNEITLSVANDHHYPAAVTYVSYNGARMLFDSLHFLFETTRYPEVK